MPPRTIWPRTPATSPSDSQRQVAAPRRAPQRAQHGGDHRNGDQAREQAVDLLDRGMADETSISRSSLQLGQSSHPRPEPVSRTAAPVMTMAMSRPRATTVISRYRSGEIRTAAGYESLAPRRRTRTRLSEQMIRPCVDGG